MVETTDLPYTHDQIVAWLRGLLTIAWADGHYDPEEQEIIAQLTQDIALTESEVLSDPIAPAELVEALGDDPSAAENFLRTAVLVAIADGVYSPPEMDLLQQYNSALGLDIEALKSLEHTLYKAETEESDTTASEAASPLTPPLAHDDQVDVLQPIKKWLDGMDVDDPRVARFMCKMIPAQCPFERDIKLFGKKIVHIPPMCKVNPLYEQLVGLRFRSLSYLADDCNEDVSEYI